LHLLRAALSKALQDVFRLGMIVAGLSLLIVFWLPAKISAHDGAAPKPPPPKACGAQSGERLVMAELTTIDAEHEPVAAEEED
jgi:hypothetical protein